MRTYGDGELFKIVTKDENHARGLSKLHTTEEFKNKSGQVILKRTYALVSGVEEAHDTYYVYDDLGNLTFVFPPKVNVNDGISAIELSELSYQYTFDYRNRMVKKQIPGKAEEYIIYDALDRPVLTQDANLRANNQWLFTKFDVSGRPIYTGKYSHGSELNLYGMQNHFDTQNNNADTYYEEKLADQGALGNYYSNNNFPSTNVDIFTVNYYDNYIFDRAGAPISTNAYNTNSTTRLKGLATGSKVKVLTTNNWITTVTYYDEKARPFYVYSNNSYLQTTDIVASKLDFVGKVEETTTTHKKIGKDDIVSVDMFTYDHTGRLLKQSQKINNRTTEEIVANTYDELGQLKEKKVGGNLQTIDFTYNIRGWLTKINEDTNNDNDLFNFEIKYNSPTSGNALFNGNIAQTSWQTLNDNTTKKTYTYAYDALNRLLSATGNVNSYFNVSNINYDKNGNILNLARQGHIVENPDISRPTDFGQMDNLKYTYSDNGIGNKLLKVEEINGGNISFGFKDVNTIGDDYSYDLNGNMTSDLNKGINSIIYNHLNLPVEVQIENKGTIDYIYDATGIKLRKIVTEEHAQGGETVTNTDYAGNYMYESGELQFFNHIEGYVKADVTSSGVEMDYVYQYKDHLGNVRLSYTDNNKDGNITQNEIVEESNYYPFGLKHKGYNGNISSLGNSTAQKWDYLGQERQEELGLNWVTFRHRNADPALGRFFGVDPVSEDYMSISTYQFAHNSPVWKIELEGLEGVNTNPNSIDVPNHEPVRGHTNTGSMAIPIGDSTARNYGSTPNIRSRESWGARSPITGPDRSYDKISGSLSEYYNTIVVHHSGNGSSYPTMNDVQNKHMDGSSKKADIGYHFGIDKDGKIYEGRPIDIKGAHVSKANTGKIGIVLLGDFDTKDSGLNILEQLLEMSDDKLTSKMQNSLSHLIGFLMKKYDIKKVGTHKEVNCERNCAGDKGQEATERAKRDNNCQGVNCETGK